MVFEFLDFLCYLLVLIVVKKRDLRKVLFEKGLEREEGGNLLYKLKEGVLGI